MHNWICSKLPKPRIISCLLVQLGHSIRGPNAVTLHVLVLSSAPGGTRIDEGDTTKVTAYCVFTAEESHAALRLNAQVQKEDGVLLISY